MNEDLAIVYWVGGGRKVTRGTRPTLSHVVDKTRSATLCGKTVRLDRCNTLANDTYIECHKCREAVKHSSIGGTRGKA